MNRRLFLCAAALAPALLQPAVALAADQAPSLDGLVMVKSDRLQAVWLLPGADFRVYTKVMLAPAEVAFRKDWMRDYNDQAVPTDQINDSEAQSIIVAVRKGFDSILAKAFTDAGYPVVTTPGKDVLLLRSAVLNLAVTAPAPEMSINTVYSRYAGQATLVLEARDSLTLAILGRAEDAEAANSSVAEMRNSVTNHQDFSRLGRMWAEDSVKGLAKLKANSPFQPTPNLAKP